MKHFILMGLFLFVVQFVFVLQATSWQYRYGADNTVEENSSIFSLIWMC